MDDPFLSEANFVSPSLNRVRAVDLPGSELPISAAVYLRRQWVHRPLPAPKTGLAYAGSPQTVALMLGTAIGVGIPPESRQGLRDLPMRR